MNNYGQSSKKCKLVEYLDFWPEEKGSTKIMCNFLLFPSFTPLCIVISMHDGIFHSKSGEGLFEGKHKELVKQRWIYKSRAALGQKRAQEKLL